MASLSGVGSVSVNAWMGVFTSKEIRGASSALTWAPVSSGMRSIKGERETRAHSLLAVVLHNRGIHVGSAHADRDVAEKSMLQVRTAVKLEDNLRMVNLDVGDHQPVTGLGGGAVG